MSIWNYESRFYVGYRTFCIEIWLLSIIWSSSHPRELYRFFNYGILTVKSRLQLSINDIVFKMGFEWGFQKMQGAWRKVRECKKKANTWAQWAYVAGRQQPSNLQFSLSPYFSSETRKQSWKEDLPAETIHFASSTERKILTMRFRGSFIFRRFLSQFRKQFDSKSEFPLPSFRRRAPFFLRSYSSGNSLFNLFMHSGFSRYINFK